MKNKFLAILIAIIVAAMLLSGCGSSQPAAPPSAALPAQKAEQASPADSAAKVTKLAMDYFANFPDDRNMVTVKPLFEKMDAKENMLIVDIRQAPDYEKGHLAGAINIPYGKAIAENLEKLPNDKPLMIYCYTGQTSSQTVALLNVAGKKAKNIQFGFNRGISQTEGFEKYMTVEKAAIPAQTYSVDTDVKNAVMKYYSDAEALVGSRLANMNIAPNAVKAIIDTKDKDYFILSVRSDADFKASDIPTASNIPFGKGMEKNFSVLPQGKKIIVSCYTGQTASQTIGILRLMGYEAYNLNGGMGRTEPMKFGWLGEGYATAGEKPQNVDAPAAGSTAQPSKRDGS